MNQPKKERFKTSVGGQALMEGIMMRGPKQMCCAVRKPDGTIETKLDPTPAHGVWMKIPLVRGAIAMIESMIVGYRYMMYSAQVSMGDDYDPAEEETAFEKWVGEHLGEKAENALLTVAAVLGGLLAILLFTVLPTFLVGGVNRLLPLGRWGKVVLEAVLKVAIFLTYMVGISKMKEIHRVFEYHGAEHKTIACYEAGDPLTVENVRKYTRFHPRCGTSFLILVVIVSVFLYSVLPWGSIGLRVVCKLLLLPLVVGITYFDPMDYKAEGSDEWIGFDACLMSSLEVASVLAPYANYMIASQETEPGWGWNYDFLSELSDEVIPGDVMGEYIVDSYMDYGEYVFDYYPNLYSDLTLSCIDLNAYAEAEEALNDYFAELDTSLDVQNYPRLVRNRARVRDFGTYSSDMDYGMVDVLHLLELVGNDSEAAQAAAEAVENCIVYSGTNMDNAGGISICYPYQTDADYRDACIEMLYYLGFAPNYTRFLEDFYAIENGDTLLADREISNAETSVTTQNDGAYDESDITLQLTPEQQANFASGGYYILCKARDEGYITAEEDERADDMYLFIQGSTRVTLDENGFLHAAYKNNAVYMQDQDGLSDIPMILTETDISDTENRYLAHAVLMNYTDNWESQTAKVQIVVSDEYPDGIIRSAIPLDHDDAELQSASKQLIHLDDYETMSLMARCSYVTRDDNGNLLNFFDWEKSGWMMGFDVDLTGDYHTVVQPLDHPENYVCIFFMKDSQGNTSYSEMIPLK